MSPYEADIYYDNMKADGYLSPTMKYILEQEELKDGLQVGIER